MKRIIFPFIFIFSFVGEVQANCQWGYTNALTLDITHARELLSTYSTCRGNCKSLETNLNRSITKMGNASSCAAHIYTRTNKDMINFIAGRFRLIQKQKQGSTWTAAATGKPVVEEADETVSVPLEMDRPAFVKPQRVATPQNNFKSQAVVTPYTEPSPQTNLRQASQPQRAVGQTRMTISREAYSALWEQPQPRAVRTPARNFQRAVSRKPQPNQNNARQRQIAQQRLIQHRKQALIQQKQLLLVKAKKRAMQNHLQQQRLRQQRLLKRRELARHVNRQRAQQRKAVMAQRRR